MAATMGTNRTEPKPTISESDNSDDGIPTTLRSRLSICSGKRTNGVRYSVQAACIWHAATHQQDEDGPTRDENHHDVPKYRLAHGMEESHWMTSPWGKKAAWYKVINDIIPTNERFHRIRISPTDSCRLCDKKDTLQHPLTECGEGEIIWIWTR
jgi:hypothetical protein